MFEKKQSHNFKSPDMSNLKAVVIDRKTVIYVPIDDDPEEARARYWTKREMKKP
jgi:hypothetical protein